MSAGYATYDCPGGHLVVGLQADTDNPECPECYQPPGPRWRLDSYVGYHADMLHERGLYQGDLNEVQRALLAAFVVRRNERRIEEREADMEQQLFLHRPEVWRQIQEDKKAKKNDWETQVQWKSPSTLEEAQEVSAMFAQHAREVDDDDEYVGELVYGEDGEWLPLTDSDLDEMMD